MGIPFISHLEPTKALESYDSTRPHDDQQQQQPGNQSSSSTEPTSPFPQTFLDAMSVRERVFVEEQGFPLRNECDADDARSCHWVIYASVKKKKKKNRKKTTTTTTDPEQQQRDRDREKEKDPRKTDDELMMVVSSPSPSPTPKVSSETRSLPIGTVRIVPFPHPPHPVDGGRYVDNVLQEEEEEEEGKKEGEGDKGTGEGRAGSGDGKKGAVGTHDEAPGGWSSSSSPLTLVDRERQSAAMPPFGADRATTFHDGKEPYVSLGRVAVLPEFRGHRIAGQLWGTAKAWLRENPAFFNPSVKELGLDQLRVGVSGDIPQWNGLVCCHAQEAVVKVYERWGFQVDKGMGRWFEEGVPHVGMFQRLEIKEIRIPII
ncbi:hypothetical protein F4778DRAFT_454758 [Xylariomycetidae sp. FL2044]|nr:hypothetical protein F4778DRAFT_454758 [Xylariomycetidae sp. FL2044]